MQKQTKIKTLTLLLLFLQFIQQATTPARRSSATAYQTYQALLRPVAATLAKFGNFAKVIPLQMENSLIQ